MNFVDPVKFLFAFFAILINSILLSNDLGFIPCGHTYCTSCLRVLCGSKDTITCPECQKHHDVPKVVQMYFHGTYHINDYLI